MEKPASPLPRILLYAAAGLLFFQFGLPMLGVGGAKKTTQPLGRSDWNTPTERTAEESLCTLTTPRYVAVLSTRGASLSSYRLTDARYEREGRAIDLVTTTREARRPLRTDLRLPETVNPATRGQLEFDDVDWVLEGRTERSCTFRYETPETSLVKTVTSADTPFELRVRLSVTNKSAEARTHRATVEQTAWHTKASTEGHLGRQSEFLTSVDVKTDTALNRRGVGDFEPDDFGDKEFTGEKWRRAPGTPRWVSVSSSYFASALVPLEGPTPQAEALIEEAWDAANFADKEKDPGFGHVYRARLAYPEQVLQPGASVAYEQAAFLGPKERGPLAAIAGGGHDTTELLDMGWFAPIGKLLVQYVYLLQGITKSWGWAIVLLTITVKLALFPLSLAQIRSSIAMRRLKPEMDEINRRFKDDAAQRGLALQELWRKNKVANPITGCFPLLLQMPIWFALYTALQTAVELYHVPFGPFIPDLSAPGKYFIIPAVLGASSLLQQRMMPAQGDPAQQKMMQWMMPIVFTVMMLFLPAGLGVYMLTNTWLGILQQVLMERYLQAKTSGPSTSIEVREKQPQGGDGGKEPRAVPVLGKGNQRARG